MTHDLFQASKLTEFCKDDSRRAQEFLPELIERLVHESAPLAEATFPWGNHISKAGYDGEVTNPSPNIPHVPQGKSVWEMGINEKPKEKFREDLKKRSENPLGYDPAQTIFCFVTPQKFTNQSEEIQKSPDKELWKDIKIYDADDLRSWLNTCPKTELWVAGEIGALPKKKIERLQDFYNAYAAISRATNKDERKILPPALLLAGREEYIKYFQDWLAQERPEKPYLLEAETAKEAAAFIYASLYLSDLFPLAVSSLIVHSKEVAEALSRKDSTPNKNLLLIITSPDIDESLCQTLTNKGWKVIWAVGAEYRVKSEENILSLPWRKDLEDGLKQGFPLESYHWTSEKSLKAGRSVNRLLSLLRDDQNQKREAEEKLKNLLPAILAGSFSASSKADREILSLLSGCKDWDELEDIFESENTDNRLDGKLIKIGERGNQISWHIRAPQAELIALIPIFRDSHGEKFKQACLEVFGGHNNDYSSLLRKSLAQSLAIMGSFPEKLPSSEKMQGWAHEITTKIFKSKEGDLKWWTQDTNNPLVNLAECNPYAFLKSLKALIQNQIDWSEITSVDLWETSDLTGESQPDNGNHILWALEVLAWMPDYFHTVTDILAELIKIWPQKTNGKKPSESLKNLFIPWNPQTSVSIDTRHKCLKKLIKNHHSAISLLFSMLPENLSSILIPSAFPKWHEIRKGSDIIRLPSDNQILLKDYWDDVKWTANQLIEISDSDDVNKDARWARLISRWQNLYFLDDWRIKALAVLKQRLERDGTKMPRTRYALYQLIQHHRLYRNPNRKSPFGITSLNGKAEVPDWVMPSKNIFELEGLLSLTLPKGTKDKFLWAFKRTRNKGIGDFLPEKEKKLEHEQQEALAEMLEKYTAKEISKLIEKVSRPSEIGKTLVEINSEKSTEALKELLQTKDQYGDDIMMGAFCFDPFKAHINYDENIKKIKELWDEAILKKWDPIAEVRLLLYLPHTPKTWQEIDKRPKEVQNLYWKKVNMPETSQPPEEVLSRFKKANRSEDALQWAQLALYDKKNIPPTGIIQLLGEAEYQDSYSLNNFFNYLESNSVPRETLLKLEWRYYSLLKNEGHIKYIFEELSSNPYFFADLFLSFRENPTEKEKNHNQFIFGILLDWIQFKKNPSKDAYVVKAEFTENISDKSYLPYPGWDYGIFDPAKLRNWIKTVKEQLNHTDWKDLADLKIGEILAQMATFGEAVTFPKGLAEIFEDFATDEMIGGFCTALFNRRGLFSKAMLEGGKQEYTLAKKYLKGAEKLEGEGFTKMAKALRQLGKDYQKEAEQADNEADRKDLTGIISF